VENVRQVDRLRAYGCLLAQGHHFARALPPDEAAAWATVHGLNWERAGTA
jgi:sensor c-di-GMP phosphodiesterase-like protein